MQKHVGLTRNSGSFVIISLTLKDARGLFSANLKSLTEKKTQKLICQKIIYIRTFWNISLVLERLVKMRFKFHNSEMY